ncbi:hypothetical protein MCC93_25580 [Morococcus cerebrosus]|uniref:Uncharacterized protein n=1 Tax=Morococcus cerebrosus TaxID=1056807 RepID=A0A0C1GKH6_9NEIS|nr:hypothetical protein MCC93_25580 [Morococcus cerebrosus]
MVSFVLGQLCVAHGNLSCRTGRMLPHTGLFLLWKVALQMRIRRRLKNQSWFFRRPFYPLKRRQFYKRKEMLKLLINFRMFF